MSKRFDVIKAIKALVATALPGAEVKGLDKDAAFPDRIQPGGLAIVRESDPGEPEVDLSPLTYNYDHGIPVELAFLGSPGRTASEAMDEALAAIGALIEADRTLGGLCDWLEGVAPPVDDVAAAGAAPAKGADLIIRASYHTASPI